MSNDRHRDQDYDVQAAEETEMQRHDPGYLIFAAMCDAERDCDNEIPQHVGIASLVVAQLRSGCKLTLAEVEAYRAMYNQHAARRMACNTVAPLRRWNL